MADDTLSLRDVWPLDPDVAYLNHGSFGASPRAVLAAQAAWRERMEAGPVRFLDRELERHLDIARAAVATFVRARPDDLVFTRNTTTAINAVLASLRFQPGDEILVTDHEYNAVINAARRAAARDGAAVRIARLGFPVMNPDQVVDGLVSAVTTRTRLALVSHVTSPTALVFPIQRMVRALHERDVPVLVDGAHAPGMLDLDLETLDADWYAGDLHKWVCAPKGAAFLWASRERQSELHPAVTSHGANDPRPDRSRFQLEFDWTGTDDPTPWLAVPAAIEFLGDLVPGGWPALRAQMRATAIAAQQAIALTLDHRGPLPPAHMLGAMATVPVPIGPADPDAAARLRAILFDEERIEVPVVDWPVRAAVPEGTGPSAWLIRVSAAPYTTMTDVERLCAALRRWLDGDGRHHQAAGAGRGRSETAE